MHVTLSKHTTVQMPQAGSNVSFAYFLVKRAECTTLIINESWPPRRNKALEVYIYM